MWISFHLFINDPVHKCALPIKLIICCRSIWLMVTRYKGAAAPVEWWMAWCLTEAEAVCPLHSSSPTWSPSSHLCQCWDPGQVSGRDSRSTLRRLCYRYSHFTPHADFGTKVLLSWRFYKLKPLMPYLNGETCIGDEKRQHRRGKYRSQKARSPSWKRFPTSATYFISGDPKGVKIRWVNNISDKYFPLH